MPCSNRSAWQPVSPDANVGQLIAGTGQVAVRKAIAAALHRIEANSPALARLLRDTVHTGTVCRYEPDPGRPTTWLLDGPRSDVPRIDAPRSTSVADD